jgi:hypothetical protein
MVALPEMALYIASAPECVLMTVMLAKTYVALKAAGASDEQAQAAAEELGSAQDKFDELRAGLAELHTDIVGLGGELHADIAYLRGRFDVLLWAVGVNAAATIAILGVMLRH